MLNELENEHVSKNEADQSRGHFKWFWFRVPVSGFGDQVNLKLKACVCATFL